MGNSVGKPKTKENIFDQLKGKNQEKPHENNNTEKIVNPAGIKSEQVIRLNGTGTESYYKTVQNDMTHDLKIDETDTEKHGINKNDLGKKSFNPAKPIGMKIDSNIYSSDNERNHPDTKDSINESSKKDKEYSVKNNNKSNNSVAWGVFMGAAGGLLPTKHQETKEENKWPIWNTNRKIKRCGPNWNFSKRPCDQWPKWNTS